MKITIASIDKGGKDKLYSPLIEHYCKIIKSFAKLEIVDIFDKNITKAQDLSPQIAKKSYTTAFEPIVLKSNVVTIVLDPAAKEVDSFEFASLLKDKSEVALFIGGAYGFEKEFLDKCNYSISFGKITLSHKLVKLLLLEQTYRALSINNNHPYHK